MRITRAAKVAAFPLIVLALVALVACQGAPVTKVFPGDRMATSGAYMVSSGHERGHALDSAATLASREPTAST